MAHFISQYFSTFKGEKAQLQDQSSSPKLHLRPAAVMGILNVTPDSFSDGGSFGSATDAIDAGMRMVASGAEIIDVGGESTRPNFTEVDAETEISRVLPVVKGLAEKGVLVSIDTRHAAVAKVALKVGAQIINDVSGFRDSQMRELAAASQCGCVVMSDAKTADEIRMFWKAQSELLLKDGVPSSNIMLDPGFGFGKRSGDNIALMQELPALIRQAMYPVLVGVSRKRFIGALSAEAEAQKRDAATLGADLLAVSAGASVLRAHDVAETVNALSTFWPLSHLQPCRALIALGSEVGACESAVRQRKRSRTGQGDEDTNSLNALNAEGTGVCKVGKESAADFNPKDFLGKSFDEIQFAANLHCMQEAVKEIAALPCTKLKKVSGVYETAGALGVDAPVLNAVLEVETSLLPYVLLKHLLAIEKDLGRGRPDPRTIDCDLLWMEGVVCQSPALTLPHPGMGKRHFVLRPLVDVIGPPCHFLKEINVELVSQEERIGPVLRKLKAALS